jgi:dTDP-glucose 4,6-dehydratase
MRLLVTGAAGFIGSNFVRHWRAQHPGDEIVGYDLMTYAGNEANLEGTGARLIVGDIADGELAERTLTGEKIDVVVNFAAESHNSLAVQDPVRFFRTNVTGTVALLEAAARAGVSRFHHVSTCEVYGDMALDDPGAFTEGSPYRPRTPYNASKAAADHAVRAWYETYGIPITISNCSNNYGPYQFPEKVVPLFITNALDGLPLPMYASTEHKREWLHVEDHCRAIERILIDGTVGETYNIGSGVEASIEKIAETIISLTGASSDLKQIVPDRPGHDRRYLLDSTKIKTSLGWEPQFTFDEGLSTTVEWYRENRAWWEPLRERALVDEQSAWRA